MEELLTNLLSPRAPQETGEAMSEWTDAIDTIIDNLEPERDQPAAAPRGRGSSATLHSSLTRETAVLHSAQEEETYSESVLVVAEDTPADQDSTSRRRCSVAAAPSGPPGGQSLPPPPPGDPFPPSSISNNSSMSGGNGTDGLPSEGPDGNISGNGVIGNGGGPSDFNLGDLPPPRPSPDFQPNTGK